MCKGLPYSSPFCQRMVECGVLEFKALVAETDLLCWVRCRHLLVSCEGVGSGVAALTMSQPWVSNGAVFVNRSLAQTRLRGGG
jgi:hypothetical protein